MHRICQGPEELFRDPEKLNCGTATRERNPRGACAGADERGYTSMPEMETGIPTLCGKRKVLLVEDEPINQEILEESYEIIPALTGGDALNAPDAGAEAPVRWKHPRLGMVSPGTFIPLLENSGLIRELDDYE